MRRHDWPERLVRFVNERQMQPFVWGATDCVTLGADAVLELTGVDPIADVRGQWATEEEADVVLATLGGLEAALDARLTRTTSPQRGDIGIIGSHRPKLALIYPPYALVQGETMVRQIKIVACSAYWSV